LDLLLPVSVILLPLLVSIFLFIAQKALTKKIAGTIAILAAVTYFILALSLFIHSGDARESQIYSFSFKWISLPGLSSIDAGFYLNFIARIMLLIITGISLLVQVFSLEYMKHDKGYNRYYAYLSFFTFSMIGIVMSGNLLLIFIFWELVGFASYLLIGFWFTKSSAIAASKKAFIVNRVGDMGFLLGILIVWSVFKTLDLQELIGIAQANSIDSPILFLAGLGLFAGCIGKSAQFPLQIWLPDAMEGPTPVSALIHAATMVAAGVFLLARIFFLLNVDALTVIAFIGAITAFMGAYAALTQNDIKKVLAFSTISQLGYMVMGMGVGAYQASLFHLITHAFFKAGLFLSAGSVIHALHESTQHFQDEDLDVQDMRNMGGLRTKLPVTFTAYCITAASLVGLPFFSGFLSKDALIAGSIGWSNVMNERIGFISYFIPFLALATVLLTAFYMGKQIILLFLGELRLSKSAPLQKHIELPIHENGLAIKIPLIILSLFSLFLPFSLNPIDVGNSVIFKNLSEDIMHLGSKTEFIKILSSESHHSHYIALIISLACALAGLFYAGKLYLNKEMKWGPRSQNPLLKISRNNWYLDRIYHKTLIALVTRLSVYSRRIDQNVIDPFLHFLGYFTVIFSLFVKTFDKIFVDGIVNLSVYLTGRVGVLSKSLQGGRIQYYFIIALLSLIFIIYLTII
jgi:NADH-quinone oxidoreductase subunit L